MLAYPYFTSTRSQEPASEEQEKDQPDKEDDSSIKSSYSILKEQALEISTAHGYPIIFKAETWYGKLLWSLICLGAIAAFVRQTYILMDRYLEFPVTVEVRDIRKHL